MQNLNNMIKKKKKNEIKTFYSEYSLEYCEIDANTYAKKNNAEIISISSSIHSSKYDFENDNFYLIVTYKFL